VRYINDFEMRHVGKVDAATGLLVTEVSEAVLRQLDEYSHTLPTLTEHSVGRVWKARFGGTWILGYCHAVEAEKNMLGWRRLLVVPELRKADR
jgi:hypothetical protein